MEFFRIKKDIPFMKYALVLNAISFITFALAVFFLVTRGLHLSVEFTGGTVMEVAYTQTADIGKVRDQVAALGYPDVVVQNFGTSRDVMIRLPVQKGVTSAQQSGRCWRRSRRRILRSRCGAPNSLARRWARNWCTAA